MLNSTYAGITIRPGGERVQWPAPHLACDYEKSDRVKASAKYPEGFGALSMNAVLIQDKG
jgi:hypothetical protein